MLIGFGARAATVRAGADRRPGIRARRFRRLVHDAHNQRTETAVSHRPRVHRVRVLDIRPVRVPKEEAGHCRYVCVYICFLTAE